jgi:hypothetical protein
LRLSSIQIIVFYEAQLQVSQMSHHDKK